MLEDVEAKRIAKYQHWKYSAGDQVDFFENTVNPKRTRAQSWKKYLTPCTKSGMMSVLLVVQSLSVCRFVSSNFFIHTQDQTETKKTLDIIINHSFLCIFIRFSKIFEIEYV